MRQSYHFIDKKNRTLANDFKWLSHYLPIKNHKYIKSHIKLTTPKKQLHLNKTKIFNDFNLPMKNDVFSPKSIISLNKSVGKIRWQFLLALPICQCQRIFKKNDEQKQYLKPLASKKILASMLANDFKELGQKTARWQGYILKYIGCELLRLTPYTKVEKAKATLS